MVDELELAREPLPRLALDGGDLALSVLLAMQDVDVKVEVGVALLEVPKSTSDAFRSSAPK